ncbi:hypothetical protein JR316_0012740 [Psilocybe cubensis]|uniref:Uncharacterized protein n=2 Tax=Psilocybe cubensis TaxID=181762 RepID=A0ACB8GIV1_PSICU|nr:hypothetical protein JR316_0012740 [Psilocybe cubensis]KAH9475623.1 hypothetical protein JR316_0012740 [Psilocybe cubensis]
MHEWYIYQVYLASSRIKEKEISFKVAIMESENPVVSAIRFPSKLEEKLKDANKAKVKAHLPQVDWNSVSSFFKAGNAVWLVARDDAAKVIKEREDKNNPKPPGVEYFTVVWLYTIAETIVTFPTFNPGIEHATYGMLLVNARSNLMDLKKDVHAVKTLFFRAGKEKDGVIPGDKTEIGKQVLAYLQNAAKTFKKEITALLNNLEPKFYVFYKTLLENILATPWCNEDDWPTLIEANKRFCVTETTGNLYTRVFSDWIEDNGYYEVSLANENQVDQPVTDA